MMKKRISISVLTLLFLVSTIGMPVSYHLCKMMDTKSLSECERCKNEMEEIESSCCSRGTFDNKFIIGSETTICCHTEFVYNKVEDEFVNIKSDIDSFSSTQNLSQSVTLIPAATAFSLEVAFYCDSSPPFLINPELHITNSIFLI